MGHTSEHIHLIYSTQGSIRYPTCTIGFFYLFLYSRVQWHIPHNRDFSTGPGSKESNVQVQMSVLIRLSPGKLALSSARLLESTGNVGPRLANYSSPLPLGQGKVGILRSPSQSPSPFE